VKVRIDGRDLPGSRWHDDDGRPMTNVHVGTQIGREPQDLVPGDAASATWTLDVRVVVTDEGSLDFRGPAVQGRRGERFLYLTWGEVGPDGAFTMFRRAKLMLDRVDPILVRRAEDDGRTLVAEVALTDSCGGPTCARVDAPMLTWSVH
jgi:Family of unknown function (DUF5990)